ncbi:MAG: hypothetical protein KDC92_05610 [Bacteroidetes bacterium]|nr:hypothetical protein [Bacteroidota bacterium]
MGFRRSTLSLVLIGIVLMAFNKADTDWFNVLGLTFADKAAIRAFAAYGEQTNYENKKDTTVQLNWEEHGIAASLGEKGHILSIYFFNEKYILNEVDFKRFKGKLPLSLNMNMTPEEVIEEIGTPTKDEGTVYRNLFYKTNYEYEFLYKKDVMQYMRIGVLNGKVDESKPLIGED